MASRLQTRLLKRLKNETHSIAFSMVAGPGMLTGLPDVFIMTHGATLIMAEIKEPGDTIKGVQEYRMRELAKRQFEVYVIKTKDEVDWLIEHVKGVENGFLQRCNISGVQSTNGPHSGKDIYKWFC